MKKHWLGCLVIGLLLAAPQLAWPDPGEAFYNLKVGESVLENATLDTLEGGKADLLDPEMGANVFIFFRPGADPSRRGLADMAKCDQELAGYPVHWTALVSDRYPVEDVREMVTAAGFRGPILIDKENTLYGQYGVRLHPVVGVTDAKGRLTAYQAFSQINFCARVKAKVLYALGEISAEELEAKLNPRSHNPRAESSVAQRNLRMGERFLQIGNYQQALDTARHSLELDPELAAGHGLAAHALAELGQCDGAKSYGQKALELDPAEAKALAAKAKCGF